MGPLSHVYVTTQVCKRATPLLVFGSILPDISWGSKIRLGEKRIHYAPREFDKYLKTNYPGMVDLGTGVVLHADTRAADFYSDDRATGFAFQVAPKLVDQVADLLELYSQGVDVPWKYGLTINSNSWLVRSKGANPKIALVFAHNFVEMGVEMNVMKHKPQLLKMYQNNLLQIDVPAMSQVVARYLQIDTRIVKQEMDHFLTLMTITSTDVEDLVPNTILPLLETLLAKRFDPIKQFNW